MANFQGRNQARKLRLNGQSIYEIAVSLKIAKSTVSHWCRDIKLNSSQIERLTNKQKSASYKGRIQAAEKKRNKRLEEIKYYKTKGIQEVGSLNKRDLFLAGIGIYWGEGDKSLSTAAFTSSGSDLVLFMMKWFQEICEVKKQDFILRIGLNKSHIDRIKYIENYWSVLTGLPLAQFTKTTIIKTKVKKVYENRENYYGTLRISIRRSSRLQRKILGWIGGVANYNRV